MLKNLFGDKKFYKSVLAIAFPIMVQTGITNFVNLLDNLMVGSLGTEEMNGVAIVNQLIFVFNLLIFGLVSGAGIFTAQFHGNNDEEHVRQTFRFKLITCSLITVISLIVFKLFGHDLLELFIHEGELECDIDKMRGFAHDYLAIALIGIVPWAISQAYGDTLKGTEQTRLPMVASLVAVAVNCIGNYLLIFGKFGLPKLGVNGAAIATVTSRFIELAILVLSVGVKRNKYSFIKGAVARLFVVDKQVLKQVFKRGTPLFFNEALWSIGVSAVMQCYSVRGSGVIASYNITNTVMNTLNIVYMSIGTSVGIIVGKLLGAKQFDEAVETDKKLISFAVLIGTFIGLFVVVLSPFFPLLFNTSDDIRLLATKFLLVSAFLAPFVSFMHSCYYTLRSGGKTIITFIYDSMFVLFVTFPLAYVLVHFTSLPVLTVYIICNGIDILKCISGYVLLKKRVWVNHII